MTGFLSAGLFNTIPDSGKYHFYGDSAAHTLELSTAYDLSDDSRTELRSNLSGGVTLGPQGEKLLHFSDFDKTLEEYTLSTAFDISTKTLENTQEILPDRGFGCVFGSNLDKLLITDRGTTTVEEYSLNGEFDISSVSKTTDHTMSNDVGFGCHFNDDGTKWYTGWEGDDVAQQFNLGTPFDLSSEQSRDTLSTPNNDVSSAVPTGPDGKILYVFHHSPDDIYKYDLTTAWDITTATNETVVAANDVFGADRGQHMHPAAWY